MQSSGQKWLHANLGDQGFGELRGKTGSPPQDFFDLRDQDAYHRMLARAIERSGLGEVWVGLAPRIRRSGENNDVAFCRVLFVDCDTPESAQIAENFPLGPSWCVKSGSITDDGFEHRQFGWLLTSKITRNRFAELEDRLVPHLKGDGGWTRSGCGVVRIPGTLNHKTTPPRPVTLDYFHPERRYPAKQFEELLPESAEEVEHIKLVEEPEAIVVSRRHDESVWEELERHLREGHGSGRNERVYQIFLRRLQEEGATKAEMLSQEDRVTKLVNEVCPSDHPYNEGKEKGEYRKSVKSRLKSGLKRRKSPKGLGEIQDAASRIPMSGCERRCLNVFIMDAKSFHSLSVSISVRDAAIRASTCRTTTESSISKLCSLGLLKRTRKGKEGKSASYKLQIPADLSLLRPPHSALDGVTLSEREIAIQSQFSSSFAFPGLSLRTFSALLCLDNFISSQELADLLDISLKTARRHLARLARLGLIARFGGTFKAMRSNLTDKLRRAAKMLGTAWVCERRNELYRDESAEFRQSRECLKLNRAIQIVKSKIARCKVRGVRPFKMAELHRLHRRALDLVAPRPPTRPMAVAA